MPKARTAVTATIRYRTGGRSAARETSHADVAVSPMAAPEAATPAATASISLPVTGRPKPATRTSARSPLMAPRVGSPPGPTPPA